MSGQTVPTRQQMADLTKVELDQEEVEDSQQEVGTMAGTTTAREEGLSGD